MFSITRPSDDLELLSVKEICKYIVVVLKKRNGAKTDLTFFYSAHNFITRIIQKYIDRCINS